MGDRIVVMKDGVIQQVAAPLELYHRPANLFVAGFIGSPPMNFLQGRLEAAGGRLHFRDDTRSLPVAPDHEAALAPHAGQPVTLGIRPEAVLEPGSGSAALPEMEAEVEVLERMGAETLVHLRAAPHAFIAKFGPDAAVAPGDRLRVRLDAARAAYFNPADGQAIVRGRP